MDDTSQIIEDNFHAHIQTIPLKVPGMAVYTTNNLGFVDCGFPCDTFNIVHIQNGSKLETEELNYVKSYYEQKNSVFCLWLAENQLLQHTENILYEAGFIQVNKEPGMYLDLAAYSPAEHPDHTHIRKLLSVQEVADFAAVLSCNWQPPDQQVVKFYEKVSRVMLSPDTPALFTVYYEDLRPVATLEMIFSNNNTVGLYNLSTLAAYRGKGIGTALMTYSLNQAKKLGFKHAVLQASEDGIGIYKRLGFTEVISYYEYQCM